MRKALIALVVLTAVVLMFRGCQAHLNASGATVHTYFRAVAAGDAATACRQLAGAALVKLRERTRTTGCEQAVVRLSAALSTEGRARLRGTVEVREVVSGILPDFSSRTEILMAADPLGAEWYVLGEVDGREVIIDWGWDVRRLS